MRKTKAVVKFWERPSSALLAFRHSEENSYYRIVFFNI